MSGLAIDVGLVLQETYRVEEKIGEGGMGAVFRASHVRLPKQFAIKVLQPEVLKRSDAYSRFRREAEVASSIGHPNIVEVHDFNLTGEGQPYIVMELLTGEDLRRVMKREAPFDLPRTLELVRDIAAALGAAHARGVIHRDLKPQNVFLARRAGRMIVKVLDFGISKISGASDVHTNSSSFLGTPAYMSPEQARGESSRVDARSDQFSLGTLVYEMLSGRRAFVADGDNVFNILMRITSQDPAPLVGVPEAVAQVVLRALSKDPDARFPGVEAFAAALADAEAGRPVAGRELGAGAPAGVAFATPIPEGGTVSDPSLAASQSGLTPSLQVVTPQGAAVSSTEPVGLPRYGVRIAAVGAAAVGVVAAIAIGWWLHASAPVEKRGMAPSFDLAAPPVDLARPAIDLTPLAPPPVESHSIEYKPVENKPAIVKPVKHVHKHDPPKPRPVRDDLEDPYAPQ
jgi:serine/threonine-protein kinase